MFSILVAFIKGKENEEDEKRKWNGKVKEEKKKNEEFGEAIRIVILWL